MLPPAILELLLTLPVHSSCAKGDVRCLAGRSIRFNLRSPIMAGCRMEPRASGDHRPNDGASVRGRPKGSCTCRGEGVRLARHTPHMPGPVLVPRVLPSLRRRVQMGAPFNGWATGRGREEV